MSRLNDGFKTLITFTGAPNLGGLVFWEKEITPPGYEGGGANDTTTMRNLVWRTRQPKKLVTLSPMTGTMAYDPAFYVSILTLILNINQAIIVKFPDNSTLTFYGWLDEFKPNSHREGEQPTASATIIPSNQNAIGAEVGPIYAAA